MSETVLPHLCAVSEVIVAAPLSRLRLVGEHIPQLRATVVNPVSAG